MIYDIVVGDFHRRGHEITEQFLLEIFTENDERLPDLYKAGCEKIGFDITKMFSSPGNKLLDKEYVEKFVELGYKFEAIQDNGSAEIDAYDYALLYILVASVGGKVIVRHFQTKLLTIGGYGLLP